MISQVVALAGGNLHQLMSVAALCLALLLPGAWWWSRRAGRKAWPPSQPSAPAGRQPSSEALETSKKGLRLGLFITAVVAVALYSASGNLVTFWLIGLLVTLLVSVLELFSRHVGSLPAPRPGWQFALFGLCALCVTVTLVSHRPDIDDASYVAIAVSVADDPDGPLLARDMVLGLPDVHPLLRAYRAQTLEVLEGTLAYLTGFHALDFAHLVIPAIAAFLTPLAYARLFRLVIPARWIWGVVVVLLYLLLVADTHRSYGNFAFVRLHQGKAIFLSVLVPLLISHGLQFARAPNTSHWVQLAATQIASVGMTVSALWMAPLVAGLAVACGVPDRRHLFRILLLGASTSSYVLLLGLWMSRHVLGSVDSSTVQTSTDLTVESLQQVLGQGRLALVVLFVVINAWVISQTPIQQRFLTVFPLGFLVLWSPYWAHWLAENLTHPWLYWRAFWVLPVPALLAVALTAPIESRAVRWAPAWLRIASSLAAATALFYWGSSVHTLSSANGVRFGAPTWKVPREAFSAACAMTELVPAGAHVLAPPEVEAWIPALHDHPFPLMVRDHYLAQMGSYLGAEEIERRRQLVQLVSASPVSPNAVELLRAAVRSYPLAAVCLAQQASTPEAWEALRDAGLQRTDLSPGFEIWSRTEPGPDRRRSRACRVALPLPNGIRGTSAWLRQAFGYSRPAPSSPTREAVKPLWLGEDSGNER